MIIERQHSGRVFAAARKAVGQRGSAVLAGLDAIVGGNTTTIHKMTSAQVMQTAANLMAPTHMNPQQPIRKQAVATGLTWSEQTAQVCLPKQAHAVDYYHNLRCQVISAVASKKLPPTSIVQMDENIIEYINVIFSPGFIMKGLPQGPQRVRQAFQEDLVLYDQIVNGANERAKKVLLMQMFPPKPPENMAWQTLFFDQINNFLQVDAGLNGQQSHIGGAVYILSHLVDYNGFGKPCSVQAEGPPGLGKSYIMKVLCEMINAGKVLKCNSYSKEAMTYEGMKEQTVDHGRER